MLTLTNIQGELEAARERLKGVEENIKKSIGRDLNAPGNQRAGFKRAREEEPETQQRNVQIKRRINTVLNTRVRREGREVKGEERISAKKRLGEQTVTVFSRLSGPPKDEDVESPKSRVPSQVIVQDSLSRKDILEAQSGDKQCKARNRRMFGALLGTLQKFRQEEDALKEKEEKRAQVEKKLEDAALREREEMKKTRQELFSKRRQQQIEIRQLEYKLMRLKQLDEWESSKKHLLNFIQTSASPKIFYMPKKHNEKSEQLLEETREKIQKMIEEKRDEVDKAIANFSAEKRPRGVVRVVEKEDKEENGHHSPMDISIDEMEEIEPEDNTKESETTTPQTKNELNGSISDKENLQETIQDEEEKVENI